MRFPAGERFDLHKGVHPKEVLDSMDTGYVRLTVDDDGMTDYHVVFCSREIVGALCEFADGRRLYSKEAIEYILTLKKEVLAETVVYSEKNLNEIRKNHPEIFLDPKTVEKFKVGSTIFTGILRGVKSGDLLSILTQLEEQDFVGCLRVTRETEEAVQEGVVILDEMPVAALFETGHSAKLGDDALREIALAYTEGRVYKLEKELVENFIFFNNASRLKSPVEEIIASEKASEDLKRFMALQMLGLDRGTLVLNAPCNGTFSFETLLRSASSRKFNGYLWVRSKNSRGLMVMGQGKIQAACAIDTSGELMGIEALREIYENTESMGTIDFYQLSYPPKIRQSFESAEEVDSLLVKKLLGEMEQGLARDVSRAKEFKKRWKDRREQLGE
jgi:hypothetical protein